MPTSPSLTAHAIRNRRARPLNSYGAPPPTSVIRVRLVCSLVSSSLGRTSGLQSQILSIDWELLMVTGPLSITNCEAARHIDIPFEQTFKQTERNSGGN